MTSIKWRIIRPGYHACEGGRFEVRRLLGRGRGGRGRWSWTAYDDHFKHRSRTSLNWFGFPTAWQARRHCDFWLEPVAWLNDPGLHHDPGFDHALESGERGALGPYADWLLDRGDESGYHCLKWLDENGRWPGPGGWGGTEPSHSLPGDLVVAASRHYRKGEFSFAAAVFRVRLAWLELGWGSSPPQGETS